MSATQRLARIAAEFHSGRRAGIHSVCSAHPLVIEATLRHGLLHDIDILIEATCNQVNQDGGYTGMTPEAFRAFVEGIARTVGFAPERLILGGDHLGPNPWKHLSAEVAMEKAEAMIAAYAHAGFTKLHLDTSMGCAGEGPVLDDAVTAERAARLAAAAEAAFDADGGGLRPVYVIGTEVPVPGGALEALDHLEVTCPQSARHTVAVHRAAFAARGLEEAFSRVIGLVVQPGVEFGHADIVMYRPQAAAALSAALADMPQLVFEAHSTDYQPPAALAALVQDGFAILKVGPGLTFALREALYGLSAIADILAPDPRARGLPETMEALMLEKPDAWRSYYHGSPESQRVDRHFSLSDRIRYYWPEPTAQAAVDALLARLGSRQIPTTLVSQYLGGLAPALADGEITGDAAALIQASLTAVLETYRSATAQASGECQRSLGDR